MNNDKVPELVVSEKDAQAIPHLNIEQRRAKVWDFRVKGVAPSAIAKVFGVSEKTVYEDLKAIGEKYREQLLKMDAVGLIAENIQWLDEMEMIALHEVNQSEAITEKIVDPKTGEVREQRIADPNKGKMFQCALKARELKIRLLEITGIIPKNRTELFDKLSSYESREEVKVEERSEDEIKASIARLMKHGRFMPQADHQVKAQ